MLRSLRTPALARRTALRQLATVVCAPSNNLNSGFTHYPTAKELYAHIRQLSQNDSKEFVVRNFVGVIEDVSVAASTVETELFPLGALEYYTKKNMGWEYTAAEAEMWQLQQRGGEQGDYRDGIDKKITNAIDCLKSEPLSKRATITFPFSGIGSETNDWTYQGMNKCCRELHLYESYTPKAHTPPPHHPMLTCPLRFWCHVADTSRTANSSARRLYACRTRTSL